MKNSKIYLFIGVFLIGFGGSMIHIGLGIMAAGITSLVCSWLEFEKEKEDGNKDNEEANTKSSDR